MKQRKKDMVKWLKLGRSRGRNNDTCEKRGKENIESWNVQQITNYASVEYILKRKFGFCLYMSHSI